MANDPNREGGASGALAPVERSCGSLICAAPRAAVFWSEIDSAGLRNHRSWSELFPAWPAGPAAHLREPGALSGQGPRRRVVCSSVRPPGRLLHPSSADIVTMVRARPSMYLGSPPAWRGRSSVEETTLRRRWAAARMHASGVGSPTKPPAFDGRRRDRSAKRWFLVSTVETARGVERPFERVERKRRSASPGGELPSGMRSGYDMHRVLDWVSNAGSFCSRSKPACRRPS